MTARKKPDVWIEITEEQYPRTVPPTTVTTRRSTRAMAFPTKIPGRVRAGSYSEIERALSDWQGNVEAATFSWEEEDSDGQGRQLAARIGTTRFAHPEVAVKMLSEVGRKAGLTPRTIMRGYLSSPPTPSGNRKVKYEAVDAIGSRFYHFDPEAPIQNQFITREHLIPAGITATPAEKVGKPYNIVIGEHTDRGATTVCGTSAVKGLVPVDYVGQIIMDGSWESGDLVSRTVEEVAALLQTSADAHTLEADWADVIGHEDSTLLQAYCDNGGSVPTTYEELAGPWPGENRNGFTGIGQCDLQYLMTGVGPKCGGQTFESVAPPVLTGSVVGAGGTSTWYYAVTGITQSGAETAFSNIVTVTNAPSTAEMSASNYVHLAWTAPVGQEDIYAGLIKGYRICGRRLNPPAYYLAINSNGGTWTNPETTYDDGIVGPLASELPFGTPSCRAQVVLDENNNPVLGSDVWGVFVVALGAVQLLSIYGSDLAQEGEPARVYIDPSNPDVKSPLSADWPHTTPYVDMNGTRLTLFYARGTLAQQHIDGTVTFAVNVCGAEDVGDGSGTMISEAGPGLQWLLNEVVLRQYRMGLYGPLVTYADGTPVLKTTSFATMQAATVGFVGGTGYQIALCLTERTTLSEVLQMWCNTFTAHVCTTQHGQIAAFVFDPTAARSSMKHLRGRIEIDGPLPDPEVSEEEIENKIVFKWDYDADAQNYRVEAVTAEDETSQRIYGVRNGGGNTGGESDEFIGLRCTRDEATARDAMSRRRALARFPVVYQELPLGMIGYECHLGDSVRVTHEDGFGLNGYEEHVFFVTRQAFQLNGPQQRVRLVGRYVDFGLVTPLSVADHTCGILDVPSVVSRLSLTAEYGVGLTDRGVVWGWSVGRETSTKTAISERVVLEKSSLVVVSTSVGLAEGAVDLVMVDK